MAAPPAREIWSIVDAHELRVASSYGARVVVCGSRVEHAAALQALLGEGVALDGWVVVGGMDRLTVLSRIDSLFVQAIYAHIPVLRLHPHDPAHLRSFRAWSITVRLAVEEIYGELPEPRNINDAGAMLMVRGLYKGVKKFVFKTNRTDEWARQHLNWMEMAMNGLRYGTAVLVDAPPAVGALRVPVDAPPAVGALPVPADAPPDRDADSTLPADTPAIDALPEVFGNQKVEPAVKDEMPEVAKPSAVESQ